MARYVDGFVIALPKKKVGAYRKMARLGAKVWKEHGALEYYECVGEDLKAQYGMMPFPKLARLKKGETVAFSWDRLPLQEAPQQRECEGHEGSAHEQPGPPEGHAVRYEAHGLRRL